MEWERLRVGLEYTQSKSMDIPEIRYEKRSLSDSPTFRLPVGEADLSETLMDKEKSFYWGHF